MSWLRDSMEKAHKIERDEVLPDYYKPRHEDWLRRPDKTFSPAALEHARKALAGEYLHERSGRFSPSAIGSECEREMLFSFAGAPQVPRPISSEDKMEAGTFEHLRWQMEGLTAGWLIDVEVWLHSVQFQFGGSMDGLGDDRSPFEFKNTSDHLYVPIKTGKGRAKEYAAAMHHKHRLQLEGYFWLCDLNGLEHCGQGSIVYQNVADKETFEVRVTPDPGLRRELQDILISLEGWVQLDALPEMLDGCWKAITPGETPTDKEETVYRRCAYRLHCPDAEKVLP